MRTKEARRKYKREWNARNKIRNPEKVRLAARKCGLRRKYGISVEDFDSILISQNGQCAICKSSSPGGHGEFHVDHDHDTGQIRGLLCWSCNGALGKFHDNSQLLRAAIKYLERKKHAPAKEEYPPWSGEH